jgi:UDP-glucose 4-epimerase
MMKLSEGVSVLVTGGAGFIGSHLVSALVNFGVRVTVFDDLSYGSRESVHPDAHLVTGDICSFDQVAQVIADKSVVFHLAAQATTKESSLGWKEPTEQLLVNTVGTSNVLRALHEINREARLIFASTAAVYGRYRYLPMDEVHPTAPISPYGISKLAAEHLCWAFHAVHGLDVVILRLFNAYGPGQHRYVMIDLLRKLAPRPKRLEILGDGNQIRDYTYISDAARAVLTACEHAAAGTTLNVCSGRATTIRELAVMLVEIMGLAGHVELQFTGSSWVGDIPVLLGDPTRLENLGFSPKVDLVEGITRLREWLLSTGSPGHGQD